MKPDVLDFTTTASFTPTYFAILFSNSVINLPPVDTQPDSIHSFKFSTILFTFRFRTNKGIFLKVALQKIFLYPNLLYQQAIYRNLLFAEEFKREDWFCMSSL